MTRDGKLLYHLTALENIESILKYGLHPRSALGNINIEDVADSEIIRSRGQHRLEDYVPFHFFVRNPFDYAVQRNHEDKEFVLIAIHRSLAQANNWKVIPRHPLAGEGYQILDYTQGMAAIDWAKMEHPRDYQNDRECKLVCMAECLSPTAVNSNAIFAIYVKNEHTANTVKGLVGTYAVNCHVNTAPNMFVGG